MSSKVQAAKASQTITLATALENVKKVFGSVLSKEGQKFYLGHNFQLLSNPPRKEDAPTYDDLLAELKGIVSIASDTKPEKQIKSILGLIFKQANPKEKKEDKQTATSVAASSFQASVQAFLASQPTSAKKDVKATQAASTKKSSKKSVNPKLLKAVTEPVFAKFRVKLTNAAVYNAHTNDFGKIIKTLRSSQPIDRSLDMEKQKANESLSPEERDFTFNFGARNIQEWGKKQGFTVAFTNYPYFPRDNLFRGADDSIITFKLDEKGKAAGSSTPIPYMKDGKAYIMVEKTDELNKKFATATTRTLSRALYCLNIPLFFCHHDHFIMQAGGNNNFWSYALHDLASFAAPNGTNIPFEGGNFMKVTHPKDPSKRKLFVGDVSFHIALHMLRQNKAFDSCSEEMEAISKQIQENLSKEQIYATAREMFAQGLLKIKGKDGCFPDGKHIGMTIAKARLPSVQEKFASGKKEDNLFVKVAVSDKFVSPFPEEFSESDIKEALPLVVKYLAQKEMLKRMLCRTFISKDGNVEDVHIMPPLDYHLDVFMMPGPRGSMFLQDYSLCAALLHKISAKADQLGLSKKDKEILARYIKTAEELAKDLAPIYSQVKAEIEKAGYTVIPTPGIFYDVNKRDLDATEPTCNLNFMNSITGYSEKMKSFFFLAAGAKVGDLLGNVMMKAFEEFLQQYGKIQVGFIGHDPEDETEFSEAMNWWNSNCQAGPHCYTFEQETAAFMPDKA